jgi:hypothetical protein
MGSHIIGIDFDNTIVQYDEVFFEAARMLHLISEDVSRTKTHVRESLLAANREYDWTVLQGHVYGPGMRTAVPFPGLIGAINQLRRADHRVVVISHRTRVPCAGPRYDLHAAAYEWIERTQLEIDGVFFEETREAKVLRVKEQGCAVFVDDMLDVLLHANFPDGVAKLWFNPSRCSPPAAVKVPAIHSWKAAHRRIPQLLA